ncbi:MAG TPA: hypothetical protein RMH99_22500 [Sandaracinaceae bacterium LLY-WYZ-13_1]|nr:hypothetical protein [Sandaracinaceae bacterium LLY-WYZ-13_1]
MRIQRTTVALALAAVAALVLATRSSAQTTGDPFAPLTSTRGTPVMVPPRALAVIPERHTDRRLRMVDVLERIDPQFDDLARGAGLRPERAIQLRTREANLPIFVEKSEASVSTVLQLDLGARIEVRGVLIERGGRYLFLASDVRPSSSRRRR